MPIRPPTPSRAKVPKIPTQHIRVALPFAQFLVREAHASRYSVPEYTKRILLPFLRQAAKSKVAARG